MKLRPRRENGFAPWLVSCHTSITVEVLCCSVVSWTDHSVLGWMFFDMFYISGMNLLRLCKEEFLRKRKQRKGWCKGMIKGRRRREEVRKVKKEKGIRVRMAKGRVQEERGWEWGNREVEVEGGGVGTVTFWVAAPQPVPPSACLPLFQFTRPSGLRNCAGFRGRGGQATFVWFVDPAVFSQSLYSLII